MAGRDPRRFAGNRVQFNNIFNETEMIEFMEHVLAFWKGQNLSTEKTFRSCSKNGASVTSPFLCGKSYPFVAYETDYNCSHRFWHHLVLWQHPQILFWCCFVTEINWRGDQEQNNGAIFIKIGPGVAEIVPVKVRVFLIVYYKTTKNNCAILQPHEDIVALQYGKISTKFGGHPSQTFWVMAVPVEPL